MASPPVLCFMILNPNSILTASFVFGFLFVLVFVGFFFGGGSI